MNVSIDLVADAAAMVWASGLGAAARWLLTHLGAGVRLLLSAAGDVVGVEVLGWSVV